MVVSSSLPVKSGVPQGSILGPLLFLIYINNMVEAVSVSRIQLYADDSQCMQDIHNRSDCDLLQEDLNSLLQWSSTWNMGFNVAKCAFMRVGNLIPDSTYHLSSSDLSLTTEHKDVGVLVTSKLSFSKHLRSILAKAYCSLGLLRRLIPPNSDSALKH